MYGVEITSVMLAIAVVVRIDAYGMLYSVVLGVMILLPRRLIRPPWLLLIVIHGLLLILQYSMLLGVPPGLCFYPDGNRRYPWENLSDNTVTSFGLKKWLFLSDYPQILEKSVLYGKKIAFLFV
jgi:hypothetical protein